MPPVLSNADCHFVAGTQSGVWRRHGRRIVDGGGVRHWMSEDELIDAIGQRVR